MFRDDTTFVGDIDTAAIFPDFPIWRSVIQSITYSNGEFTATVSLEHSALEPTSIRTFHVRLDNGVLTATIDPPLIADPADCPDYLELAQQGDGIPVPCDSIAGLQRVLSGLGYPLTDDGQFGPATAEAVRRFQTDHGLPATGVVDYATWIVLLPPD